MEGFVLARARLAVAEDFPVDDGSVRSLTLTFYGRGPILT
jgi:hypothetical protein